MDLDVRRAGALSLRDPVFMENGRSGEVFISSLFLKYSAESGELHADHRRPQIQDSKHGDEYLSASCGDNCAHWEKVISEREIDSRHRVAYSCKA